MFGTRQKFVKMEGEPAAGGGGAGGTPPAGGEGGTPPAGGEGGKWYDSFKDADVKGWLGSFNDSYPDAEAVALKAYNMERFLGADKAGRGVIVPKPDAKPEEWREFYAKVGNVPEKPDGYKIEGVKPEMAAQLNADPMVQKFREHAHKVGMPPAFFKEAMGWYVNEMASMADASFGDFTAKADAEIEELKGEWQGGDYQKNIDLGLQAARQFLPHENEEQLAEVITRMEGALGTKTTLKLLANIGTALGEHSFEAGGGNGSMSGMTPESARLRISALKQDKDWQARWANRDAEALAEWDNLHKIAFGGKKQA